MSSKSHGESGHGALAKKEAAPALKKKNPDEAKAREIRKKTPGDMDEIIDDTEFMKYFLSTTEGQHANGQPDGEDKYEAFVEFYYGWELKKQAVDEVADFYQDGVSQDLEGTGLEVEIGDDEKETIDNYLDNLSRSEDGRKSIEEMRHDIAKYRANQVAIATQERRFMTELAKAMPKSVRTPEDAVKFQQFLETAKREFPASVTGKIWQRVTFKRDKDLQKNILETLAETYGIHSISEVDAKLAEINAHLETFNALKGQKERVQELRANVLQIADERNELLRAVQGAVADQIGKLESVPLTPTSDELAANPAAGMKNKMKAHRARTKLEELSDATDGEKDYLAVTKKNKDNITKEIREAIEGEVERAVMYADFKSGKPVEELMGELKKIIDANESDDAALLRDQMIEILNDLRGSNKKDRKYAAIGRVMFNLEHGS